MSRTKIVARGVQLSPTVTIKLWFRNRRGGDFAHEKRAETCRGMLLWLECLPIYFRHIRLWWILIANNPLIGHVCEIHRSVCRARASKGQLIMIHVAALASGRISAKCLHFASRTANFRNRMTTCRDTFARDMIFSFSPPRDSRNLDLLLKFTFRWFLSEV